VYLRLSGTASDQLGVYDGTTGKVALVLELQTAMTAFLRRANGALLVAAVDGSAFMSQPGATDFARLAHAPHLLGLGERAGKLYAATDSTQDDFAVAMSEDDGASWRPLLRLNEIGGLRQCGTIASTCAAAWEGLRFGLAMPAGPRPGGGQLHMVEYDGGCSVRRLRVANRDAAWLGAVALFVLLRVLRVARRPKT
jgi:hypothetical protein